MISTSEENLRPELNKVSTDRTSVQRKLSNRQKKFLRKLARALAEVVDEDGLLDDDSETSGVPGTVDSDAIQGGVQDEHKQSPSDTSKFEPNNVIALRKFAERHNPLRQHIQSLLDTVGGGARTAKSLEKMQEGLNRLSESLPRSLQAFEINTYHLYPDDCVKSLQSLFCIIDEMSKALREFGVFNTGFFSILRAVQQNLQRTIIRLDGEYGHHRCRIEEYLDSIFEPLAKSLEIYAKELTGIAEKEIPAIRQSQEFTTQRYLNLTTIATFLSSVTATTLQITAGAPVSVLNTITNSFWFVSLVFSSASAVYSLLVMTWRQSPIRRPDRSLPSLAHFWLRNGPMFALIVALTTFSVGLCLLSFLVADQAGKIASAAVPTALAGFHAHAIILLSAWYLFEQWRARHSDYWANLRDKYVSPSAQGLKNVVLQMKHRGFRINGQAKLIVNQARGVSSWIVYQALSLVTMPNGTPRRTSSLPEEGERLPSDIELGPLSPVEALEQAPLPSGGVQQYNSRERNFSSTSRSPTSGFPSTTRKDRYGHPLQFTPNCKFLASAFSNIVAIYDVGKSFEVTKTIVVPDAGLVEQVLWNPNKNIANTWRHGRREQGDLLVRSSNGVFMYSLAQADESNMHRIEKFDGATGRIRWICSEDNGVAGLSCLLENSLKVFEPCLFDASGITPSGNNLRRKANDCKELESYDLSELPDVEAVLDAAFYEEDRIVCLSRTTEGETQLLVIERHTLHITQTYSVHPSHRLLTVSQRSGRVLIQGEESTDAIELEGSNRVETLYDTFHLSRQADNPLRTRAVGCFGKDDNMIFDVMDNKLAIFHRLSRPDAINTWWLHEITTPSSNAVPRNFMSFALGHHPDVSRPYLFAFGNRDGSVKIWSILTNRTLDECNLAEAFEVHDQRDGRTSISTGKFLTLPPLVMLGASKGERGP